MAFFKSDNRHQMHRVCSMLNPDNAGCGFLIYLTRVMVRVMVTSPARSW